jgi:hypothetical protein
MGYFPVLWTEDRAGWKRVVCMLKGGGKFGRSGVLHLIDERLKAGRDQVYTRGGVKAGVQWSR